MKKNVSIVMCCYNGDKYLRDQLESIVKQTYPIYELLIQDDCSTDDTKTILKEYAAQYSYIQLFFNEDRLGYNENFRTALYKAKGDFIAISDQDDVWELDKLKILINEIADNDLCFSRSSNMYSDKEIVHSVNRVNYSLERLIFTNAISGHTMFLSKFLLLKIPYWTNDVFFDWWIALNAAALGKIHFCDKPLVLHRIHQESATFSMLEETNSLLIPYIRGVFCFFMYKYRSPVVSFFYFLLNYFNTIHIDENELVYKLCKKMTKFSFVSLFSLCFLCLRYRNKIYPNIQNGGFMPLVRGFFFPFLYYDTMKRTKMRFR